MIVITHNLPCRENSASSFNGFLILHEPVTVLSVNNTTKISF